MPKAHLSRFSGAILEMKICIRCGYRKGLSEFYRHPKMADGYLNKCKPCCIVAETVRQLLKRTEIARYNRERDQSPGRKARKREYERSYRIREPVKYAARNMVRNAIRDGRLARRPCEICGKPDSQAHHEDYNRPLDVTWLCFKHHREIGHGQIVNNHEEASI